ncbi:MAG: 6-phosphogluconate dehydrogenase, decarboxylating, partial [uncultured Rubrobacteraceae bacterium]
RAFGVRALRQDGPQRHRVRHDAGLRRGLRAHAAQGGVRARPAPGLRDLARRQRGALLAPRPHCQRPLRRRRPRRPRPLRAGLGRGTLDGRRGHRAWRRGSCYHDRPRTTLLLARGRQLRQQAPQRDAQPVRRPRAATQGV